MKTQQQIEELLNEIETGLASLEGKGKSDLPHINVFRETVKNARRDAIDLLCWVLDKDNEI